MSRSTAKIDPVKILSVEECRAITKCLIGIDESPKARFRSVPFDDLSEPEKVFHVVWRLEGQVNNGGFWQYFWNSSGDHAFIAPYAFEQIGARKTAQIIREACAPFPNGIPARDRSARHNQMREFPGNDWNYWKELDEKFFACDEGPTYLLYAYVVRWRSEICGADDWVESK
jgi:hypothetical protein